MTNYALYGNLRGSEIIAIDINKMAVSAVIPCSKEPYAVDQAGSGFLLSITRKLNSTDKISTNPFNSIGLIELDHSPRTAKAKANESVLISGANKTLSTVLKLPEFSKQLVVGEGKQVPEEGIQDFGGNNASGHEAWIQDGKSFLQLDRIERKLIAFEAKSGNKLWELNTPTTPHHALQDNVNSSRYYIVCEGSQSNLVPPSLIAIEIADQASKESFQVVGHIFLPVEESEYSQMGGHHVDQQPDGKYLYMGSAEGYCYIIDARSLEVVKKLPTGKAHGHTGFVETDCGLIAVAVNHRDLHVTLIDVENQSILENIKTSDAFPTENILTQGHTTGDLNGNFYIMISHEARFIEIDIAKREILRTLDLKEALGDQIPNLLPLQGTFLWDNSDGKICTNCH